MNLVLVSTYPPRLCGLATFTDDLRTALRAAEPGWDVTVCAVDRDGFGYGAEVLAVPREAIRPAVARALASLEGSRVITTFGLIGPGKGLENAIAALAGIVDRHPDVRYVLRAPPTPRFCVAPASRTRLDWRPSPPCWAW